MSFPSQEGASLDLAKAALQQGRFSEAIEYASALTSADSSNFGAWQILGAAHASAGNYPAAVDAFSQAARLQPMSAPSHFNLAKALIAAGETNRAQVELQSCISLDSNYQKARELLQQINPGALPSNGTAAQPVSAPATAWGPPPTMGAAPGIGTTVTSSYAPGQVASPFGSVPLGGQPAGQTSSYGQPTPPGQYGAPSQPGGYPSSATLIGQGYGSAPASLLPATQAWSIISIILGVLCLGMFSLATIGILAVPSAGSPMLLGVALLDALIAIMFVVGSAGTLARKGWGRTILMGTAVAAIVMLGLDLLMITTGLGMPATPTYANPQAAQFAAAYTSGAHAGALIFDPLKMIYCLFLFLHLKSDRVKETMNG